MTTDTRPAPLVPAEVDLAAAVRRWIQSGNSGTLTEICAATGLGRPTVHHYIRRLAAEGVATIVGKRGLENVWALAPEPVSAAAPGPAQSLVQRALAARLAIERAWHGSRSAVA